MEEKLFNRGRKIAAIGLFLVVLPMLFKDYFQMSDFFRGFFMSLGVCIEFYGLVLTKRSGHRGIFCRKK